ncbi:hypothetical protein GCM10010269_56930 [Streptomyces humidus]|uniref:Uncharacterized protein n=1 Tax=Streptomyces humidus TaxID=52259 RepID=A0A918G022_9ACTN|nr:hypothetical protein GCM10010269_56930 [Streptomyces humidus]
MEWVGGALGAWVPGLGIDLFHDAKLCCLDGVEQLLTCPEAEVLCQVGQDEPSLAARSEAGGQTGKEAVKHGAVRIVDALFDGAGRTGGEPGRVADDEVGAAFGEQAGT